MERIKGDFVENIHWFTFSNTYRFSIFVNGITSYAPCKCVTIKVQTSLMWALSVNNTWYINLTVYNQYAVPCWKHGSGGLQFCIFEKVVFPNSSVYIKILCLWSVLSGYIGEKYHIIKIFDSIVLQMCYHNSASIMLCGGFTSHP